MDWYRILAMAAVGAVAGGIAGGIASLAFGKEHKTARLVLTAGLFIVLLVAGNRLVEPLLDQRQAAADTEGLLAAIADKPPYLFMKKHDPAGAAAFREEAARIAAANQDRSRQGFEQLGMVLGWRAAAHYFFNAADEVVLAYLAAHLRLLDALDAVDPHLVCRSEFPQHYGLPDLQDMEKFPAWQALFDTLERVISNAAATGKNGFDVATAQTRFEAFAGRFLEKNPDFATALHNSGPETTDFTLLSRALRGFYRELQALPAPQAAVIYRYMRSQN